MPDVTSTLLAMYQQVIGGSTAREQSSLEAECARRVILSGMVIGPLGNIQISGGLTVGGNLAVTGSFSLTGLLTVGSLVVTGNATVGGTLGVTGLATLNGGLTVNGTATVNGPINAGNIAGSSLTSGTTLTVATDATISGSCSVGNLTVAGLVTVTGANPAHAFTASGAAGNVLTVRNTSNGAGSYAGLNLGNDTSATALSIQAYSSTFPTVAQALPNGVALVTSGAGGLTLNAGTAFLRVMTGATQERMRILATGEYLFNTVANLFTAQMAMIVDGVAHGQGLVMQNTNATNALQYCLFLNSVGAGAGAITQTGAGTVAFQTTSDARLKIDDGVARDLSALRGVTVHDFRWKSDHAPDRGVFAQEAFAVCPRAVSRGTDELTETGDLKVPWMTDYSKFVPDLIVGWQQHEAELTALRALLDVKRMH